MSLEADFIDIRDQKRDYLDRSSTSLFAFFATYVKLGDKFMNCLCGILIRDYARIVLDCLDSLFEESLIAIEKKICLIWFPLISDLSYEHDEVPANLGLFVFLIGRLIVSAVVTADSWSSTS